MGALSRCDFTAFLTFDHYIRFIPGLGYSQCIHSALDTAVSEKDFVMASWAKRLRHLSPGLHFPFAPDFFVHAGRKSI